jgi:hypothetical protein
MQGYLEVRTGEGTVTSHTVDSPLEEVWGILPKVYEQLGIGLTTHDPKQRRTGNAGFRPTRIDGTRLSRFFDCGRGVTATPNADRYQVTVALSTTVLGAGDGRTRVDVEVNASAKPRDVSGNAVHCSSKGTLEERIVAAIRGRLIEPG